MSFRLNEVDTEFIDRKSKKDKAGIKFPKIFKRKVLMSKVNSQIAKNWIEEKLKEQLPDDDIVVDYLWELLIVDDSPDIESIYFQMVDFLGEKEAKIYCESMWSMLLSANEDPDGIPKEVLNKRSKDINNFNLELQETEEPGIQRKTNYNRSQYNSDKRHPISEKRSTRDYNYNNTKRGSRGHIRSNSHRNNYQNPKKFGGNSYRDVNERDEIEKTL